MSNSYTYIIAGANSSQAVYYTGVAASKSPKQIPLPKSTAKPDATASPQEAWSTLKTPSDSTVEGGLYKCSLSTGMMGGTQVVFWIIESGGRSSDVNEIVGHATVLKSVGSVLNPTPLVVPVWAADGQPMGSGKRVYYFQNNYSP